jgi:hypothetical protein
MQLYKSPRVVKKISSSLATSGFTVRKKYNIKTPKLTRIPKNIFGPKLKFIIGYLI